MENQNPTIRLYELIKQRTDEQTAHEVITDIQGTVKKEVTGEIANPVNSLKHELENRINALRNEITEKISALEVKFTNRLNTLEVDMIDRINTSKTQTIIWVVSVGILQMVARYFFK